MVPPSAQFLHGFAQAVRLDVGDERVELLAFHQGEDVRERVEPELSWIVAIASAI
jgi:hypothetical protein